MRTKRLFLLKIIIPCLCLCAVNSWGEDKENPAKEIDINVEVESSAELPENAETFVSPEPNSEAPIETADAPTETSTAEVKASEKSDKLVEVLYHPDPSASYNQRRGRWSGIYAIEFTPILPKQFQSPIDNKSYSDGFSGKKITLSEIIVGTKCNLIIGGLTADLSYGQALIKEDDNNKITRSLYLIKQAVSLGYVMDKLLTEPYFAPYVRFQMYGFNYEEIYGNEKRRGTTSPSSATTIGILMQLNWIEKQLAYESLINHELNNTFLDIFATKQSPSGKSDEPSMETGFDVGAGIKLEF